MDKPERFKKMIFLSTQSLAWVLRVSRLQLTKSWGILWLHLRSDCFCHFCHLVSPASIVVPAPIFERSGHGGATSSAREPTFQPEFALRLLKSCRKIGIHTAMETCGYTTMKRSGE